MQFKVTYYEEKYYQRFGTMARPMTLFMIADNRKEAIYNSRTKLGRAYRVHSAEKFKGF
jgi:hypothetical protein